MFIIIGIMLTGMLFYGCLWRGLITNHLLLMIYK